MKARALVKYRIKFFWKISAVYANQTNLKMKFKHTTGKPNWCLAKNFWGYGLPRPHLRIATEVRPTAL